MQKDVTYYPLYRKIKRDLTARFPDCGKAWIEAKTKNRLATFLAKEIYVRFCSPSPQDTNGSLKEGSAAA